MKRQTTYITWWWRKTSPHLNRVPATILACALISCTNNTLILPHEGGQNTIRWNPTVENGRTRAFIDRPVMLDSLCTPSNLIYSRTEGDLTITGPGGGEAIGFWADYLNPDGTTTPNVFGAAQTKLMYFEKPGGKPNQFWNYENQDMVWALGGTYIIRAFYPQRMNNLVLDPPTTANLFVLTYNTHLVQEDLLVAYNRVHTVDPVDGEHRPSIAIKADGMASDQIPNPEDEANYGYSTPFDLADPVPLKFEHALAAMRVVFSLSFDSDDELEGVYFLNGETEGLATTGTFLYGDHFDALDPLRPATQEQRNRSMYWITDQTSFTGQPFYEWQINVQEQEEGSGGVLTATTQGTPFRRETKLGTGSALGFDTIIETRAVAFSSTERWSVKKSVIHNGDGEHPVSVTVNPRDKVTERQLPTVKQVEPKYNESDGWLFIIPQKAPAGASMVFRTKYRGEFKIVMPEKVGTNREGQLDENGDWLCSNYRYTLVVTLEHADISATIEVEPRFNYYATEEIDFNE